MATAERRLPPSEINTLDVSLYHIGVSDKYGNVYVEKANATMFDDQAEPVAVLRARDNLAMKAMVNYRELCARTPGVVARQVESVTRQVDAFARWRKYNEKKTRLPGAGRGRAK